MLAFFLLLISPSALAQSEPTEPKFGIGVSLGIPTDLRFIARDIAGVQGLGVRADVGGFYYIIGAYVQAALNLEYHFAVPEEIGFYLGAGLTVYKSIFEVFAASNFSTNGDLEFRLTLA